MILFLCETKSQILNAIAIKMGLYSDDIADVCLVRKVAMPIEYKNKLNEIGLFEKVFSVELDHIPEQNFFFKLKKTLLYITIVRDLKKKLKNKLRNYSHVFVSGPGTACPAIYYGIKHNNPQVKLSLFEEGTFEYYMFRYTNVLRKWYSKLFYGSYYVDDAKNMLVYDPSMVIDKPKHISVYKIPKLFNNQSFREKVNYIFNYNGKGIDVMKNCNCLFLESCYDNYELENKQNKIVKLLCSIIGDKLIVKLHPRSNAHKYDSIGVKRLNTSQSMEMILLNQDIDINNIVFVSPLSSAMLNLKLMFGKEPKMILLNEILNLSSKIAGIDCLADKFIEDYNKQLIFQPNNLKEFKTIITKFFSV